MVLIPVSSRAIRSIGYDGYTLVVVFRPGGRRYDHPRVPYAVFAGLMNASSKGRYYNQHIRGRFGP